MNYNPIAEDVWKGLGIPYSGPAEAYRAVFTKQDPWAFGVWDLWEKVYDPSNPGFMLYQEGHPDPVCNGLFLKALSDLPWLSKKFSIPHETTARIGRFFQYALSHPDKLRLNRVPPPTLVVIHDGLPGGDFVSQWSVVYEAPVLFESAGRQAKREGDR